MQAQIASVIATGTTIQEIVMISDYSPSVSPTGSAFLIGECVCVLG